MIRLKIHPNVKLMKAQSAKSTSAPFAIYTFLTNLVTIELREKPMAEYQGLDLGWHGALMGAIRRGLPALGCIDVSRNPPRLSSSCVIPLQNLVDPERPISSFSPLHSMSVLNNAALYQRFEPKTSKNRECVGRISELELPSLSTRVWQAAKYL